MYNFLYFIIVFIFYRSFVHYLLYFPLQFSKYILVYIASYFLARIKINDNPVKFIRNKSLFISIDLIFIWILLPE